VLLDMVSRLGSGSKIVFTFDMDQQDNPYLSKGTSIVSLVNRLKSEPLFAHVEFVKSERSALAQLAGRLLKELD
jgi:PhoH-like ATPase